MFNITSTGPAAIRRSVWLGFYLKMDNVTRNGRPVWQKIGAGERYLFYNDNNYWVLDQKYSINSIGYITTVDQHLERPPSTGWKFHNGSMVVEDPRLKAQESKIHNTCL